MKKKFFASATCIVMIAMILTSVPTFVFADIENKNLSEKEIEEKVANPYTDFSEREPLTDDNLTPIKGESIKNGTYKIEAITDSTMFKPVKNTLNVKDGKMTVTMTLSGKGYESVYMGRGKEAVVAPKEDYAVFKKDSKGHYTYTFEISALDEHLEITALSKRKQKWYDHQIIFLSENIPSDAIAKKPNLNLVLGIIAAVIVIAITLISARRRNKKNPPEDSPWRTDAE